MNVNDENNPAEDANEAETSNPSDDITMEDVANLKSLTKKLKLSPAKILFVQRNKKLTPEQKAKKMFNLGEDDDVNEYLKEKLNESEINTLRKFVNDI